MFNKHGQATLSTVSGITIVFIYFVKILLGPHFSFSGFCLFVWYNKTITTILTSGSGVPGENHRPVASH
jgi:hypothetical protein